MKILDLNGLTYFFGKVKTWAGNNYLSLKGGTVNGDITITGGGLIMNAEDGISMQEIDTSPRNVSLSFIDGLVFSQALGDSSDFSEQAHYNSNEAKTGKFVKTNGTSTQVLIADGSVKGINSANGIAGLDARGYVPLAQLGNLDTTVAEVVTTLPTTNIKKHIYLVKDASGVTQNQYEEYIYTGDTSATYDASKWEKLGDFRATVDLAGYAKTADVNTALSNKVDKVSGKGLSTNDFTAAYKSKLDSIAPNTNNYSLPLAANSTRGGIQVGYAANGRNYPVQLAGEKAYVNVPWTDTTYDLTPYAKKNDAVGSMEVLATSTDIQFVLKSIDDTEIDWPSISTVTSTVAGVMKPADKNKLDGIATGATADSAITTTEIDALFV